MRGPAALMVSAAVLAGCAPQEVLTPKPGEPPAGVDFSGLWELAADPDAEQRRLDNAVQRAGGNQESRVLRRVRAPDGREDVVVERRLSGGLVHLFLHNGKRLKIDQKRAGLFISFDRAVVEEFRFGEHREVQVGPVIAERVSGWEGQAYVAETLDENRMKLTERFELLSGGDRLRRTIVLRAGNGESATVVQEFRRVGN